MYLRQHLKQAIIVASLILIVLLKPRPASAAGDTLLPILFYTPETEFGGGAIYIQKLWQESPGRLSSIRYLAFYTKKKQAEIKFNPILYFNKGNTNAELEFNYRNFPNSYFGIGNLTPQSDIENYLERSTRGVFNLSQRLFSHLYVQLRSEFYAQKVMELEAGGLLENDLAPEDISHRILGLGGALVWDSRDVPRFPNEGFYADFSVLHYNATSNDNHNFKRYGFDLRLYNSPSKRITLAGQLVGQHLYGTHAPFQFLPFLGGPRLLRGFYKGRFRDRTMLAGQAEMRVRFNRLIFNFFTGTGQVASDIGKINFSKNFHSAWGGGIHYILLPDDGTTLTFDVGRGENQTEFYLTVDQAF